MSDEIRKDLKKLALRTEARLAESLLNWKYRKEGKEPPGGARARRDSERVAEQANRVLSERGRRVWNELKKAYRASAEEEDGKG
jgi:hypothetical protein